MARYSSRTCVPEIDRHLRAFGDLRTLDVFPGILQIDQFPEGDRRYAGFRRVLRDQLLGVVRPVERLSRAVVARAGVIAADDEMRGAVIPADDGVPERLPRAGHAHRQREQAEQRAAGIVIFVHQSPINAHPRIVVHVAGFGHPHHGMDQQTSLHLLGGAFGEFFVDPMQGIAGLKRHDSGMAHVLQQRAHGGGRPAQIHKIVIAGKRDDFQRAGHAAVAPGDHFRNQRMARIVGLQHLPGFFARIPGESFFDLHYGDQIIMIIPQAQFLPRFWEKRFVQGERNRDRKQRAVGEPQGGSTLS